MAQFKVIKKFRIKIGFRVLLSHQEVEKITAAGADAAKAAASLKLPKEAVAAILAVVLQLKAADFLGGNDGVQIIVTPLTLPVVLPR